MMIAQSSNYYYSQNVIFSNLIDGSKTYEEILGYLDQIRVRLYLVMIKETLKVILEEVFSRGKTVQRIICPH